MAICAPSPIQHEIPLYQELSKAASLDVTVLYFSDIGVTSFNSFGLKNITYGIPMLDGYKYKFIKNISPFNSFTFRFINPDIRKELKEGHYDAVILYGYYSPTHRLVMNYCKKHHIRLYLRAEGESVQPVSSFKKFIRRTLLPGVFKKVQSFFGALRSK